VITDSYYEQIIINGTAYSVRRVTGTMTSDELRDILYINGQVWIGDDAPHCELPEVEVPANTRHVPFHVQQQMRKKKGGKRRVKKNKRTLHHVI